MPEIETHPPVSIIDRDQMLRLDMQIDSLRGDMMEETRKVVKEQTEILFKDVHRIVDDLVARVRVDIQYLGNYVEDIKKVSADIETERETRARNDIDIQARMAMDSASLRTHIELTRLALQAESEKIQQAHSEEASELRALVDSVWDKFTRVEGTTKADPKYMFRFEPENESEESRYKVCVGDSQDINTLYEMAQEAVGDNVIIRKELDDEKNKWAAEIAELKQKTLQLDRRYQRLFSRVESIQLNMQEVSDTGNH